MTKGIDAKKELFVADETSKASSSSLQHQQLQRPGPALCQAGRLRRRLKVGTDKRLLTQRTPYHRYCVIPARKLRASNLRFYNVEQTLLKLVSTAQCP